jgi:regulator of sigma E protease
VLRDLSPLQLVIAIGGIGLLIAWHELGHYTLARLLGMRVLKFSIGFGPKVLGRRVGDIDYQLSALPLGGYVHIKGMTPFEQGAIEDERSYINRPRWARFLVLAAGPGFNYIMAFAFFFIAAWGWPSPVDHPVVELSSVLPASPAATAGFRAGDLVLDVNGQSIDSTDKLSAAVVGANGAPLGVRVRRGDDDLQLTVTPQLDAGKPRIGVGLAMRYPRSSFGETLGNAGQQCIGWSVNTVKALGALVKRTPGVEVQSIVGIVQGAREELDKGARYFIWLLAVISVNLGLFNLLPIPALDGIKMLFLTIEGALRRNLNSAAQLWVNALGLGALLLLMGVLMVRDTVRLIGS